LASRGAKGCEIATCWGIPAAAVWKKKEGRKRGGINFLQNRILRACEGFS